MKQQCSHGQAYISEGRKDRWHKTGSILYYTIIYYTILYYTILYYTILYYTILYYTMERHKRKEDGQLDRAPTLYIKSEYIIVTIMYNIYIYIYTHVLCIMHICIK